MDSREYAVFHSNAVHGDDAYLARRQLGPDSTLYGVFDGLSSVKMGDQTITGKGKIASRHMVERLSAAPIASVEDIIDQCIAGSAELNKTSGGMAMTTATVALVKKGRLYVVNVGDSPAILVRGDKPILLTRKDTGSEAGQEVITRAIGMVTNYGFFPNVSMIDIFPKDKLVLKTDGVQLDEDDLSIILSAEHDASSAAKKIEEVTRETTGLKHDDVTFQVVYF